MDLMTTFILTFSHEVIIIPLLLFGFIWGDRKIFFDATCLLFMSMIFNSALKITFQIPLPPSLCKEGFSFPSGHMQSSTVLYGWFAYKIKNSILRGLILFLLIGIMVSLVYCGYHNYQDIGAALMCGLLLLILYKKISPKKTTLPWILGGISTLLIFYISLRGPILAHVWMAYYGLIGFMVSEKIFCKDPALKSFSHKIAETLFAFGSIFLIRWTFSHHFFLELPIFLNQLPWGLIGFTLPFSNRACALIARIKKV